MKTDGTCQSSYVRLYRVLPSGGNKVADRSPLLLGSNLWTNCKRKSKRQKTVHGRWTRTKILIKGTKICDLHRSMSRNSLLVSLPRPPEYWHVSWNRIRAPKETQDISTVPLPNSVVPLRWTQVTQIRLALVDVTQLLPQKHAETNLNGNACNNQVDENNTPCG